MSNIIDRRKNSRGKSITNRQKFIKRVENQIKRALPDILSKESITEGNNGGKVRVPIRGIKEPSFHHDPRTGNKNIVRPGNDRFKEGDLIPKPKGSGGGSGKGKGSNSPEKTEDDFYIVLSREEFMKYFFDDLELPNLVKKFMENTDSHRLVRAGYVKYGVPSRLNVKTSYQQSLARRIAIKGVLEAKMKKLQEQLLHARTESEQNDLRTQLIQTQRQHQLIPFFDDVDLRYNHFEVVPEPVTSAVMFCIMDVSASMGYHEKDIAKRFFTLLYLFLVKQYSKVELVFIRHHTEAKEVNEEEFFNSRESGGTVVAPSLRLMNDIIKQRYPLDQWNIYCCQASDGDVWSAVDAEDCKKLMREEILTKTQYVAYLEINQNSETSQLWRAYKQIADDQKFAIRCIYDVNQIWPIFKGLFKKKQILVD